MSAYVPEPGDRVRVVIESTVRRVSSRGEFFSLIVNDDAGDQTFKSHIVDLRHQGGNVTVERLHDPEPVWQFQDVAACPHGYSYLRSTTGAWLNADGNESGSGCTRNGELTLLVRGGKVVSS